MVSVRLRQHMLIIVGRSMWHKIRNLPTINETSVRRKIRNVTIILVLERIWKKDMKCKQNRKKLCAQGLATPVAANITYIHTIIIGVDRLKWLPLTTCHNSTDFSNTHIHPYILKCLLLFLHVYIYICVGVLRGSGVQ